MKFSTLRSAFAILAVAFPALALLGTGCSAAANKQAGKEAGSIAVQIADGECLAHVPKGLEEVCNIGAGILDGLLQKYLSTPAAAKVVGSSRPALASMSPTQKRLLLARLMEADASP